MKFKFLIISIFSWLILSAGCSGRIMSSVNVSIDDNIPMSNEYKIKAYDYEKADELQLALFHLKISQSLDSKNIELKKQVAELKNKIEDKSENHFILGLEDYQNERFEEARTEFLTALRYNPGHDGAFFYLKEVMSPKIFSTYVVTEGDSFGSITEKMYGDKNRGFIIAELNNYKNVDSLKTGDELRVPLLAVYPDKEKIEKIPDKKKKVEKRASVTRKKSRVKIEKPRISKAQSGLLKDAKELFRNGKYEEVIPVIDKILETDPSSQDARKLKNASYFNIGKSFREQGEYFKALRYYGNVEQDYSGVQDEIDLVKTSMKREAEVHYAKGQEYFDNSEYRKAILEWARALTYNPEHNDARRDMEKARGILKKMEGEK